jgi:hypothetical protein
MIATQPYCPKCKKVVIPSTEDTLGWYWLCPTCRQAVTSEASRYCPNCKGAVVAWTWGPNINLVDPRPWWLRDPWFCAKCSNRTHGSKAGAAISKFFHFVLGIVFTILLLIMALGCVLVQRNLEESPRRVSE